MLFMLPKSLFLPSLIDMLICKMGVRTRHTALISFIIHRVYKIYGIANRLLCVYYKGAYSKGAYCYKGDYCKGAY